MNIYDIAKEANVSPATVSRVINNSGKVKLETRERVLRIINSEGFIPNVTARNLSIGQSKMLAFIVPDIENEFFSKILHGLSQEAHLRGYNVLMFGTEETPQLEHKILEALKGQMISGIILIPVQDEDAVTAKLLSDFQEKNIPIVLVDRGRPDIYDCVFTADKEGAYEAVSSLINEGHTRIGIIRGPISSRPGLQRFLGYKEALFDNGLSFSDELIADGNFNIEDSYKAMKKLFEQEHPPTAIFTCNNKSTIGCLQYMKEKGLELCRDLSMVVFDDIELLAYTNIQLTAVTRTVTEIGAQAIRILASRIEGQQLGGSELYSIQHIIKTHVVYRGSEKIMKKDEDNKNG